MIGIVDVGGGTRGEYSCGVLDRCMDEKLHFDYVIGVSAGGGNAVSFLAGQRGRNYIFYHDYAFRPEYMGIGCLLKTGSLIGLDYIYGTLTNSDGENPLDYDALQQSPSQLEIVATDARTGDPVYFGKQDIGRDNYDVLKASCSVPAVCRPYRIDGVPYFDGGISDPIPFKRALAAGCDRLVIVLTKPADATMDTWKTIFGSCAVRPRFPHVSERISAYNRLYLQQLHEAKALEKEGKALIVAPDSIAGFKTLTKDRSGTELLYRKGYEDTAAIRAFLEQGAPTE